MFKYKNYNAILMVPNFNLKLFLVQPFFEIQNNQSTAIKAIKHRSATCIPKSEPCSLFRRLLWITLTIFGTHFLVHRKFLSMLIKMILLNFSCVSQNDIIFAVSVVKSN